MWSRTYLTSGNQWILSVRVLQFRMRIRPQGFILDHLKVDDARIGHTAILCNSILLHVEILDLRVNSGYTVHTVI